MLALLSLSQYGQLHLPITTAVSFTVCNVSGMLPTVVNYVIPMIVVPMSGPESGSFHRPQIDQANLKVRTTVFFSFLYYKI